MTREIKFRAWDNENGEWIDAEPVYGFFPSLPMDKWLPNRYGDIQQYTGLKDKNGKEIYEGDIYRTPNGATGELMDLVVRYNHGSFGLVRHGSSGMNPKKLGNRVNRDLGEVIGNIYENPDLLS